MYVVEFLPGLVQIQARETVFGAFCRKLTPNPSLAHGGSDAKGFHREQPKTQVHITENQF